MKKSTYVFLHLFLVLNLNAQSIDIQLNLNTFQVNKLSDFIENNDDQINLILTNNSGTTTEVKLGFHLRKISGVDPIFEIKSTLDATAKCITLAENASEIYTGFDIGPLFDENAVMYDGISQSDLITNQELSEGLFQICAEVQNCNVPNPQTSQSCQTFTVFTADPPVQVSVCDQEIPMDGSDFMVSWIFIPPSDYMGMLEYEVRILEVIDEIPDTELFDIHEGNYFFNETTMDQLIFIDKSANMFEAGKIYAIQIQVKDPMESFIIKEEGKSIICRFTITGENEFSTEDVNGIVQHFPKEGDRIPFRFFPLVGKFGPYSDEYREHIINLTRVTVENNQVVQEISGKKNIWKKGPVIGQNSSLVDCPDSPIITNPERSQYIAYINLGAYESETTEFPSFIRGKLHTWDLNVEVSKDDDLFNPTLSTNGSITRTFSAGMGKSQLQLPENGSVIVEKKLTLKFKTANSPDQIGPDYYIFRKNTQDKECDEFNSFVYEGFHLQVAKDTVFSEVILDSTGIIGAPYTANSDEQLLQLKNLYDAVTGSKDLIYSPAKADAIKNSIYKDISYEIEAPKDTGTYYWRVTWLNDPGSKTSDFYESSEIWNFKVEAKDEEPDKDKVAEECVLVCEEYTKPRGEQGLLKIDSVYSWRDFKFIPTEFSKSGDSYEGKGELELPFMFNGVTIFVDFEELRINKENQIIAGKGRAIQKGEVGSFLNDYADDIYGNPVAGGGLNFAGVPKAELEGYISKLEDVVNLPDPDGKWDLPIGLNLDRETVQVKFGIFDLEIDTSFLFNMTVLAMVDLPQHSEETLVFGHKICVTPEGPGERGEMFLWNEIELTPEGGYEVKIRGAQNALDTDADSITSLIYNCNGLKLINLEGDLEFPREDVLPVDEDFKVIENEEEIVKAHFATLFDFDQPSFEFIAELDFNHLFCLEKNVDLIFETRNIVYDKSSTRNPQNFELPSDHYTALNQNFIENPDIWEGFFAEEIGVHLRIDALEREKPIQLSINNFIIDNGISLAGSVVDVLPWEEGESIAEFGISIDTMRLGIVQNDFKTFDILGKIGSKYFDEGSFLKYSGGYAEEPAEDGNGTLYQSPIFFINVNPNQDVNIPAMMFARAGFNEESHFHFERKLGQNNFDVSLSAYLTFDGTSHEAIQAAISSSLSTHIPQLEADSVLMEWTYTTAAGNDFDFSLSSPQKYLDGFPITFNDLSFDGEQFRIEASVDISESLGLSATSDIVVNSVLKSIHGRESIDFDNVSVEDFDVDFEWADINISGGLEFYSENGSTGIRGDNLGKSLPMIGDQVSLDMDIGIYGFNNRATSSFGSSNYYSFWKLGGTYEFTDPKPSIGSINFHNVGGTVFYNMVKKESEVAGIYEFTPQYESLGIALSSQMATSKESTFNMDAGITFTFNGNFGFEQILFEGDCYVMASIQEREDKNENAKVWGNFAMAFDYDEFQLAGDIHAFTNIEAGIGKIYGNMDTNNEYLMAHAEFMVSRDEFYFYMGHPDDNRRANLRLELDDLETGANLKSYIMLGTGIPSTLPDPHPEIMKLLGKTSDSGDGNSMEGGIGTVESSRQNGQLIDDAQGFAFGSSFETELEAEFFILYARFNAYLGFDLNLSKVDKPLYCSNLGEERGINGWYAEGQMYAGIKGDAGVKISVWGYNKKITFLEFGAALQIQGGVPSPSYFSGMARFYYSVLGGTVSGSSSFAFTIGKPCLIGDGNPLNALQFIQDITPKGEHVSPFAHVSTSLLIPSEDPFPLIEFDENNEVKGVKYHEIFLENISVKDENGNSISLIGIESNKRNVEEFRKNQLFEEGRKYTTTVIVGANRYDNYEPGMEPSSYSKSRVKDQNNNNWKETKTETFIGGAKPEVIPFNEAVVSSFPLKNQQYFLKGETVNNLGNIKFDNKGIKDSYFYKHDEFGNAFNYFIRFENLKTGDTHSVEINPDEDYNIGTQASSSGDNSIFGINSYFFSYNQLIAEQNIGGGLTFDLGSLDNNTKYKIEFIRERDQYAISALAATQSQIVFEETVRVLGTANQQIQDYDNIINVDYVAKVSETKLDPSGVHEVPREFSFLTWYFKTSKFDKLTEKLWHGNFFLYDGGQGRTFAFSKKSINEKFEHYDVVGDVAKVNYIYSIPPLLSFEIKTETTLGGELETDPYLKYRAIPLYFQLNHAISSYDKFHRYEYFAYRYKRLVYAETGLTSLGIKNAISKDPLNITSNKVLGQKAYQIVSSYTEAQDLTPAPSFSFSATLSNDMVLGGIANSGGGLDYINIRYLPTNYYRSKSYDMRDKVHDYLSKKFTLSGVGDVVFIEEIKQPSRWQMISKKDPYFHQNVLMKAMEYPSSAYWKLPAGKYTFKLNYKVPTLSNYQIQNFVLGDFVVPLPTID